MSTLNEAIPTNVLKIELAMRIPEISKTEEVTFNVIVHLMINASKSGWHILRIIINTY